MQKKTSKSFKISLPLKFNFSAICLSRTCCESLDSTKNSNYRLHGCNSFHKTRDGCKGADVLIFYVTHYLIKLGSNISSNRMFMFISNVYLKKSLKNITLSLKYRPPNSDTRLSENI